MIVFGILKAELVIQIPYLYVQREGIQNKLFKNESFHATANYSQVVKQISTFKVK